MVEKKEALKEIPGFSQGMRTNSAARMVKLAQPICPNSAMKMIRTPEGRVIPDPNPDPNRQNCQADKAQDQNTVADWAQKCEARGHDPYYTTRVWFSEEDALDETTGEWTKKRVRHEDRRPNITQVAAHLRVNSGQGADYKIKRFGFKRLKDIGYAEVCQFRNCQSPAKVTSRFGLYCGPEHATYIAADMQGLMLHQAGTGGVQWDLGAENHIRQKYVRELADAQQFADIKPYDQ